MNTLDQVRILIFRCHQKGLEVLLINNEFDNNSEIWHMPKGVLDSLPLKNSIELEDQVDEEGNSIKTIAIEADWHQIPSVRAVLKQDIKRIGRKLKSTLPLDVSSGTYYQAKLALKHMLPHEYQALKELKDVLLDRNLSRSI